MTDLTDFYPLFVRTEDEIREDLNTRANAGMTTDDPDWVDTREGSAFFLTTQPMVVELASAYDRLNEAVAASILSTSWGDYLDLHAASYGEERIAATYATGEVTFTGDNATLIGTGARVAPPQTDPDVDPPIFETTESGVITAGVVTLAVQALEPGVAGNVSAGTITLPVTGIPGVTGLTNDDPTSGGEEVETDPALKDRLELIFRGKGSGTRPDYAREALKWPGVGRVLITPHWTGPGTVRVTILTSDGNPTDAAVVDGLQEHLDPEPALGEGWAPINHTVTVDTAALTTIYVTATISFDPGYSLDGDSGSVALRDSIENRISEYIDSLLPNGDVIYNNVRSQPFRVDGVRDISLLKIGTSASPSGVVDLTIDGNHVATPTSVVLSE